MTHIVKVKMKDRKRAELIAPGGSLTGKRVHASLMDEEKAKRVAADIVTDNPDQIEWARAEPLHKTDAVVAAAALKATFGDGARLLTKDETAKAVKLAMKNAALKAALKEG